MAKAGTKELGFHFNIRPLLDIIMTITQKINFIEIWEC